ncbi:alpha/beta hydrolase family protein [Aeromicrobium sp. CTD01-1L150]|uniref:alpha/beta hydrolase family protein n=1 Tax=Aeromicrobium sp. CTD01-1L150 TaxID=3341830 RepID=UPI0035C0E709
MRVVFEDQAFSFELLRTLGHTYARAADVGECLATAQRIQEGDFESWYAEWRSTAERVHKGGRESLAAGHFVSAREALLRASNYYRTAEFFLHGNAADPRIMDTWQLSVDTFQRAAELFSPQIEPVEIPYEDTTLPGYFYRVDESHAARRTLIFHGGFDSTAEELFAYGALMARDRGWNVLAFDGPGQGRVIREQGLPFRSEWEAVVGPVLDYARARPDVDGARIALMGMSMGGYLVARASAFVDVAATVYFNGIYSLAESFGQMLPPHLGPLLDDDEALEVEMRKIMAKAPNMEWSVSHGLYTFGVDTIASFLRALKDYTIAPVVDQIAAPALVLDSEAELFFAGQAQRLHDALNCPKSYIRFTAAEGAEEHCSAGAMGLHTQRVFDWLEELPAFKSGNPTP